MLYCWVCPCRLCSEGEQLHVVPSGRHLTVSFLCTNFLAFLFRYKVREYRHTREFGEDEGKRHIEVQGVCGVLVYCNLLDTTARKSLARAWGYEGCWELSSMVLKRKREIDDGSELRVNCLFPTSVGTPYVCRRRQTKTPADNSAPQYCLDRVHAYDRSTRALHKKSHSK